MKYSEFEFSLTNKTKLEHSILYVTSLPYHLQLFSKKKSVCSFIIMLLNFKCWPSGFYHWPRFFFLFQSCWYSCYSLSASFIFYYLLHVNDKVFWLNLQLSTWIFRTRRLFTFCINTDRIHHSHQFSFTVHLDQV